jgi:hypothetical protein
LERPLRSAVRKKREADDPTRQLGVLLVMVVKRI